MKFDVEIKRSRRRSVAISVSHDNKITVRCPLGFSERRCYDFLNEKKDWIDKVIKAHAAVINENSDVFNYEKIYVFGKKVPLIISDKNKISDSAVYVRNRSCIKRTFIKHFAPQFIEKVVVISKKTGLTASDFSIRAYKSRWGCCDAKKRVAFNYLLFMLPEYLQEYVIVHELCHTVYLNHSKKFWLLVSEFIPDYFDCRKQLKKYDFLTKLY